MKAWPIEVFKNMVHSVFIQKDYKAHRETVLYERELTMLPETQVYADNIILINELRDKRANFFEEKRKIDQMIDDVNQEISVRRGNDFNKDSRIKKSYIRSCPGDGCRGFLDTEWKCSLCLTKVCSKCHEIMNTDKTMHVCDEAILENVKAIKDSTKPCPTCGIPTFKINGCNQMWCTSCHTTWCWRTGLVEKGVVHNPHFYEYLRQQSPNGQIPRNAGDEPCDENALVTNRALVNYLHEKKCNKASVYFGQQMAIHRNMAHLVYFMQQYYIGNIEDFNRDLRVKFIMNNITEVQFKTILQKQEKLRLRRTSIRYRRARCSRMVVPRARGYTRRGRRIN